MASVEKEPVGAERYGPRRGAGSHGARNRPHSVEARQGPRRARRIGLRRTALFCAVLAICALPPAAAILDLGRGQPISDILRQQLSRLAHVAGFGIATVEIAGHRYTAEADVVKALAVAPSDTVLTYDAGAARARLQQLPWVERAIVTRRFPDRLSVAIAERAPMAVWRRDKRDVLIDASGRQIVAVAPGSDVGLPVVSGVGGGPAAPTLLALFAGYPDIKAIVVESRRIDDRRWTLVLADGVEIRLPADGVSAALARLDGYRAAGLLQTPARPAVIDLRLPDRLVVHPGRGNATRNAAISSRAAGADVRARSRME